MKGSSSKKYATSSSKSRVSAVNCSKCHALIGNAYLKNKANFGSRVKRRKFIILNDDKARYQELNGDVDMNKESGDDQFCGFCRIRCPACNDIIGRRYLSSAGKIDELVGKVLLHAEKIQSTGAHDEMFQEQRPHKINEDEKKYLDSPEKEQTPDSLNQYLMAGSKSRTELNDAMSLGSADDEEVDEELGALEKLKQEQRAQIRTLKNSLIDFSEVIADIDDRVKRAEKDVAVLHSSLKKVYSMISQDSH